MTNDWEVVGPTHKQRYLCGSSKSPFATLQHELLASRAFAKLLQHFSGLEVVGQHTEARRFRAGLDYTVAHYGSVTKEACLDAVICVVDEEADQHGTAEDKREKWGSQDVGGYECYLMAEDDIAAEASDVYRMEEDDEPLLNVMARCNALSLVMRDAGVMRFVKYVNAKAPGSRWDIAGVYSIAAEDEEGSDREGETV